MGASFDDKWTADNKIKLTPKKSKELKPPQKHQLHFEKEKRRGHMPTKDLVC